jgi:hypothetical protein
VSRREARLAARKEERRKARRRIGIVFLVVGLLGGGVAAFTWTRFDRHGATPTTSPGPRERTQQTLLLQVTDNGVAVKSALLAHDPAAKSGAIVLVPAGVIARAAGASMPFGNVIHVSDQETSRIALSDLMGVRVDASWVLDGQALAAFVDSLGGVTVDVDTDVMRRTSDGGSEIVVTAGRQHLSGQQVVLFMNDSNGLELARLARFDSVVAGLLAALPQEPTSIEPLIRSLGPGSRFSLEASQLGTLLRGLADDARAEALSHQTLPVTPIDGSDQLAYGIDAAKLEEMVESLLADSVPEARRRTDNRVLVQNGVGTPGIGETARAKLEGAGFVFMPGGNVEGFPYAQSPSVVLVYGTSSDHVQRGQAVADALGLPREDVKVATQGQSVADMIVILGSDYHP